MMDGDSGDGAGRIRLEGPMTFETVAQRFSSPPDFSAGDLLLDLSGVEEVDSGGLALLLNWHTQGLASACRIRFVNIPRKLADLARLNGLESLFVSQAT